MIKSLSPYYLEIPFVAPLSGLTCSEYLLQIFVWNGYKTTVPENPSYEKTILNPTGSTGNSKVSISRLVNDFVDFTPFDTLNTELINGNNQQWVKTQVLYTTANEDDYVPQLETTVLMTKGYGYGMEGQNPQLPTNNILLSGTEFKVQRDGYFVFPFLIQEAEPVETFFATITDVDEFGCVFFEFNIPYTEGGVALETSTDEGANWTYSVGSATSPRCGTPTLVTRWYRLKSIGTDIYYSNIFIVTI
jgi:hypothetical protein